jgi:glycosyltransferase involved in cell wall biosynthesis
MKRRLVIITEIISPYRIPLFNALMREPEIDPYVIFLSETDPGLRQWHVYKDEIKFPYTVLPSWRRRIGKYNTLLNWGLGGALRRASPDLIVCGGYSYLASWQALRWARSHKDPFLLWSESAERDYRRGYAAVEFLKQTFLERCDAFVVPGVSAHEYLQTRGIKSEAIFTAPNAVDNDFFRDHAVAARRRPEALRKELGLPARYFLFVGRLVQPKGVFDLLSAYAKLDPQVRKTFGLVFAGSGAVREELEERARAVTPGVVRFAGFTHREQLAAIYALADVLVLPSYSEAWGLVVNEAMACELPVIVSRAAGCAADLVREQWNGFTVCPGEIESLCRAMHRIAQEPVLAQTMGSNSSQHITRFSPQAWAEGMARACAVVGPRHA